MVPDRAAGAGHHQGIVEDPERDPDEESNRARTGQVCTHEGCHHEHSHEDEPVDEDGLHPRPYPGVENVGRILR